MRTTDFLPSRHGFKFDSGFDCPGAGSTPGGPPDPAFGAAAAMAWAALDRFLAGRPGAPEKAPPAQGDPLLAELGLRHAGALAAGVVGRLVEWQLVPDRGRPGGGCVAKRSWGEWRRVRRSLDSGVPMLVVAVTESGAHGNPTRNRPLLAYGYEVNWRARRLALRVYDPAQPGQDGLRLAFRIGALRLHDGRLGMGTPVRGVLAVAYDRAVPAPVFLQTTLPPSVRGALPPADAAAAAARAAGRRTFARGAAGELLEHRRVPCFGWRSRVVEPRLPAESEPVAAGSGSRTLVLAVAGGELRCWRRAWLRGWRVGRAGSTPPLAGRPAATYLPGDPLLHVFCRSADGALFHLRRHPKRGWTTTDVTAQAGAADRIRVAGDPVLAGGGRGRLPLVVARTDDGGLAAFRCVAGGRWLAVELVRGGAGAARVAADALPAAVLDGSGTLHVFARGEDGGLVHGRLLREGPAAESVTATRPVLAGLALDGTPAVLAGPGHALHVLAAGAGELLLFRWLPGADWSVEPVLAERVRGAIAPVGEPAVALDGDGAARFFVRAAGGRLLCVGVGRQSRRKKPRLPAFELPLPRLPSLELPSLALPRLEMPRLSNPVPAMRRTLDRAGAAASATRERANAAGRRAMEQAQRGADSLAARRPRPEPAYVAAAAAPARASATPAAARPATRPPSATESRLTVAPAAPTVPAVPRRVVRPAARKEGDDLPLLDPNAPPVPVEASAEAPAPARPKPQSRKRRDQREFERLLALAEQEAPRIL
jgi:hypothetical protein